MSKRFLAFSITTYLITIYYNTNHNTSDYFKTSVLIKKIPFLNDFSNLSK